MKNRIQAGLLVIFLTILGVLGYNAWLLETTPPERTYTDFLSNLENEKLASVHIQGPEIRGEDKSGMEFRTFSPDLPALMPLLLSGEVIVSAEAPATLFDRLMLIFLLIMTMIGVWFIFIKSSSRGSNIWKDDRFQVRTGAGDMKTFADVAGIDAEEMEIVVQCYNTTLKDQKTADRKANTREEITA